MNLTDNPVKDAENYAEEMEDRVSELPVCCECGEHITDDWYYEFGDEIYCPDCNRKHMRWN